MNKIAVAPQAVAFRAQSKNTARLSSKASKTAVFMKTRAQPLRAARMMVMAASDVETLDKVREIISEQLGTDIDKVAPDAKFVDLGADSLDTVEIMMALEEQFEITLDEEGAEKIATVQEAADLISAQVQGK
eukprot:CAMPEP_0118920894 /NCGR_PEP_ID=MMETSP1169-20130426/329_1 /TAXON_ID=36882 /ORGANISM="Pyramimonas obovata, Strain CCMP722" /LENGTH=131 /DNA_ID=CAMNT_0006861515 /DNA_START=102 /DNA_END=497 /DNA_ORIENTATION=+